MTAMLTAEKRLRFRGGHTNQIVAAVCMWDVVLCSQAEQTCAETALSCYRALRNKAEHP